VVGVIGPNGSGKTSVLEALALLAPGRGLMGQELKAHTPNQQKHWGFFTELSNGTTLAQEFKGSSRTLLHNGSAITQEELANLGSVVVLTPHTDFLFSGPPETRRRWLDEAAAAFTPSHAQAVLRYRQHRQGRLKILAQGVLNGDWLDAEERLAAEWGLRLLRGRMVYLATLHPLLEDLTLQLHGTALEILHAPDPLAALMGKFARSREIDARLNRTHAGPNTLDVHGTLQPEGHALALAQASSGQHKRALLQWVYGHTRLIAATRGTPPLVLIDEFAAHLDTPRREALLAHLSTLGCQVWLADVDLPNLPGLQRIALPERA
jgi:DNA replication and repair protein RecF